jgi:hypothetical protein
MTNIFKTLRDAMEKATPGNWEVFDEVTDNDNFCKSVYGPRLDYNMILISRSDQNTNRHDADFIVTGMAPE